MKQFSLEEYLKNPNKKIVTRDGRSVRIICTNANSAYCVIGLVRLSDKEEEVAMSYHADGTRWRESEYDLFFAPVKKEAWINLYQTDNVLPTLGNIFSTKEEALINIAKGFVYMTTVKIEWEE